MFLFRLWTILVTLVFVPTSFAAAGPQYSKIALVIGNSNYQYLSNLKNATNDATAIARVLSSFGFTVFLTQNTSTADLKSTLTFVANQALQADQVIVYFAGHGRNDKGTASLLSVDEKSTINTAVTATGLLDHFSNPFTQKAIILDACFDVAPQRLNAQSKTILLPANLHPETAFIFAASYGQVAYDGTGSHSLFTGALLDRLATQKTNLIRTIQSVRSDVIQASRSHQIPITLSTLTRPFDLSLEPLQNKYDMPTHSLLQSYSSTGFSNKSLLKNLAEGSIK